MEVFTTPELAEAVTAADLRSLLAAGLGTERYGLLAGRPSCTVVLDDGPDLTPLASHLPCVVIGVDGDGRHLDTPPDLDILLTEVDRPPRPWVHCDDLAATVAELEHACHRAPLAAVSLVQLLRFSPSLDVDDGLAAESFVYSTLQAGPEHRRWLADRPERPPRPLDDGEPVVVRRDDGTLFVTLNRPRVHNAYDAAMRDGLADALRVAAADRSIGAVRLRGAGPSFCSGGDLTEFGTLPDPATAHAVRTARTAATWLHACRGRTTVEVHGACIGAGVELASFAGHVEAAPDTYFQLPEVAMGLVPGAGGTVSLPRRIGRQRTAYLAIDGRPIDAKTALGWGLVDQLSAVETH